MNKNRNLNINFDMKQDIDVSRKNSIKKYLIAGTIAFTVSCSTIKTPPLGINYESPIRETENADLYCRDKIRTSGSIGLFVLGK